MLLSLYKLSLALIASLKTMICQWHTIISLLYSVELSKPQKIFITHNIFQENTPPLLLVS